MDVIIIQPYQRQSTDREFAYPELIDKNTGESIWIGTHTGLEGQELLDLWINTMIKNESVDVMIPRSIGSGKKTETLEDERDEIQKMLDKHGSLYCIPSRYGMRINIQYIRGELVYFNYKMKQLTRIFYTDWGVELEEEIKTFASLLPQGYGLDGIVVRNKRKEFIFDYANLKYNDLFFNYSIRDIIPPTGDTITATERWDIVNKAYEVYMELHRKPYSFTLIPRLLIDNVNEYYDTLWNYKEQYKFFILCPPQSTYRCGRSNVVVRLKNRYSNFDETDKQRKDRGSMVTKGYCCGPFFFYHEVPLAEIERLAKQLEMKSHYR